MEDNENVLTPNTTENGGTEKEPVNTTENEKKQVEEGTNKSAIDSKSKVDETKPGTEKTQVEKTFTQAELNSVVENRISRLEAKHKKEMEELEQRYKGGDYSPEIKTL